MIVRSRPDINEPFLRNLILNGENNYTCQDNRFYFNSGSNALKFFLRLFGERRRVGIQVFTCVTVLETIKECNDYPVFLDIDRRYFSTPYSEVDRCIKDLDILILTHIHGIPNPDYFEIVNICRNNNVIVVNDLCQTFHASIAGNLLEDIADNYFYSFFYDKPISAAHGGLLKVNPSIYKIAIKEYNNLKQESFTDGILNLKCLYWMYHLLDPIYYKKDFRTGNEELLFSLLPLSLPKFIANIIAKSFVIRVLPKIFHKNTHRDIIAMSDVQKYYVYNQMQNFKCNNSRFVDFYLKRGSELPQLLRNTQILCSFAKRGLVKSSDIPNLEKIKNNAELALFNWPELICGNESFNNYPNANFVINNYINIPLWCDITDWLKL
jgi:hypothetical protein